MTSGLEARGWACPNVTSAEAVDGFVVSGRILAVDLEKTGINQWSTNMEILVELRRGEELIFGQTYTGSVERPYLMASDGPQEIMAEALSDILSDAAAKMSLAMKDATR